MSARTALYGLLAVVAGAAAVLSFAALRDLALLCGFDAWLAPLLPVVVDAGAAAGSLVWLGGAVAEQARRFGRALAVALLGASVAGNAVGHALEAYAARPAWWLVVAVSAVAPAVLGAVVHLAVLAVQGHTAPAETAVDALDDEDRYDEVVDDHGLSRLWADAPLVHDDTPDGDRAAELIAAGSRVSWTSASTRRARCSRCRATGRTGERRPDEGRTRHGARCGCGDRSAQTG